MSNPEILLATIVFRGTRLTVELVLEKPGGRVAAEQLLRSYPQLWPCHGGSIDMRAVKARFDGKNIILPSDLPDVPPGDVVVVFEAGEPNASETYLWMRVQETAFAKAWDNAEDAVYDSL